MTYQNTESIMYRSCKDFYKRFLELKTEHVRIMSETLSSYGNGIDESQIFTEKVYKEEEIKLKEYNFKILHNILPCNQNLMNWKIKTNPHCDICKSIQTIQHLIFDCSYAKPLWAKLDCLFGITVTFPMILGLTEDRTYNNMLTIIGFLIYKEWLILSLENKIRSTQTNINWFKSELALRISIYKRSTMLDRKKISLLELYENNL